MSPDSGTELAGLRAELAELRAEVRQLRDREEIFDCLHRYNRALDRLDRDLLDSVYHPDARDDHGLYKGDPAGFVDWVMEHMQEWDRSVHILDLNNLVIDGDTAHAECYCLFTQRRVDGGGIDFGGARYLDTLERREGGWRIATRLLLVDWTARADTTPGAESPQINRGARDRTDPSYHRPIEVTY